MIHLVISIGNTDNKLTQMEWSNFVVDMEICIEKYNAQKHFFGGASNWEQWQNVAWIVECEQKAINEFLASISDVRKKWKQESAFVIVATGMFI